MYIHHKKYIMVYIVKCTEQVREDAQKATCNMQHATCHVPHASCNTF